MSAGEHEKDWGTPYSYDNEYDKAYDFIQASEAIVRAALDVAIARGRMSHKELVEFVGYVRECISENDSEWLHTDPEARDDVISGYEVAAEKLVNQRIEAHKERKLRPVATNPATHKEIEGGNNV